MEHNPEHLNEKKRECHCSFFRGFCDDHKAALLQESLPIPRRNKATAEPQQIPMLTEDRGIRTKYPNLVLSPMEGRDLEHDAWKGFKVQSLVLWLGS